MDNDNETYPGAPVRPAPALFKRQCVRFGNLEGTCQKCADVCPALAVGFEPATGNGIPCELPVLDADACLGCNLCSAVCPTQALSYLHEPLTQLLTRVSRTARRYDTVYMTCSEAHAASYSGAMVEVPCLGSLPAEFWFACLAQPASVSVFLPVDLCDGCVLAPGEQLMMDAIGKAEQWTGHHLGLAVDKDDLDFSVLTEKDETVDRRAFFTSITDRMADDVRKAGVNGVDGILPDRSAQVAKVRAAREEAKRKRDAQFAEAHETGRFPMERNHQVLTAPRKTLVDSLTRFPALAENTRITTARVDGLVCDICKDCIAACPVQAISIRKMMVSVDALYCVGCGKCQDVCPLDAITLVETDAQGLLDREY